MLPGEVAPAHRHSQSAPRFVLEGSDACTAVNGEKTIMHEGDFIITPPMAWHDHGNRRRRRSSGWADSTSSTDATVFAPIEGRGRSVIPPRNGKDEAFVVEWGKRDVFVVPSWHNVRHEAAEDSVVFSFSDRPIQQALHLFREDRGNA